MIEDMATKKRQRAEKRAAKKFASADHSIRIPINKKTELGIAEAVAKKAGISMAEVGRRAFGLLPRHVGRKSLDES